jgi:probable O-glycosylation ligase (exosortase A-associated)
LAYVGYAVINPQSYTWFYSHDFPHSKLIVVATLLGYIVSSEAKGFPRQRESLLILGLWGLFGISTIFALDPEGSNIEFINMSKILLMYFLATSLINTEERIKLLSKVIALGLGLYGLKIGLFVIATAGNAQVNGPEGTYLESNNTIGMALAMNVPFLFYISKTEPRKWLRWLMRVMMGFTYPAVAGTFARGDWIGLGIITALMLIKSRHKFLTWTATGLIVMLSIGVLPKMFSTRMVQRYDTLANYEEDASAESRFWNWEFCRRVGMARPLTGGGFKFFSREAYARYYPEFLQRWPGKVWSCHDTPLVVLAEHGVPALLLWIALIISCFSSLRRIRWFGRTHKVPWIIDYTDMIQIGLIGFLVMGIFVDFAYYEVFFQIVVIIVAIKQRIVQRATAPLPASVVPLNSSAVQAFR